MDDASNFIFCLIWPLQAYNQNRIGIKWSIWCLNQAALPSFQNVKVKCIFGHSWRQWCVRWHQLQLTSAAPKICHFHKLKKSSNQGTKPFQKIHASKKKVYFCFNSHRHNRCSHKTICCLSCLHTLDCYKFWPISNHLGCICSSNKLPHPLVDLETSVI